MSSQQQPAADIDAVLSRFSAWSASQGTAVRKGGDARANEVSYERALQAVARSRRKAAEVPPENAKRAAPTEPADGGGHAESDGCGEGKKAAKSRGPKKKKREAGGRAKPRTGLQSKEAAHVAVKSGPAPRPVSAALRPAAPASFAEVVRQQHSALVKKQSGKNVALTVRLAPEECANIKARAAEAETSVSAYLRQCALEVEHLREQVERALAELRGTQAAAESTKPLPLAAPQARPSLWRRVRGLGARLLGAERIDARA